MRHPLTDSVLHIFSNFDVFNDLSMCELNIPPHRADFVRKGKYVEYIENAKNANVGY